MKRVEVDETFFREICNTADNMSDACRKTKLHPTTFRRIAKRLGCYKPNQTNRPNYKPHGNTRQDVIDKYLSNKQYITPASLRRQLIKYGLKENKCEICGYTEWMGKPIPLELHHKDSDRYNNAMDNLMVLCPTCHSQLTNGRNTDDVDDAVRVKRPKRSKKSTDDVDKISGKCINKVCIHCGKAYETKSSGSKYCSQVCFKLSLQRVDITSDELLSMLIREPNYTRVGNKLGISDNAVKKKCKRLGIYDDVKELIREEKVARGIAAKSNLLNN